MFDAALQPAKRLWATFSTLSPAALLGALTALKVVFFEPSVFDDPDTYWHIAAGGWMIDHGQVLHRDIFSYTFAGRPWASHEWLAEIFMAAAYRAAGWTGLLFLFGGALSFAAWLLGRGLERWLGALGQLVAIYFAFLVVSPTILCRPHILMLPILVAWTCEMIAARDQNRAPHWWLALPMVIWANLHGSFVFGFVLLAGFGLEALIASEDRLRVIRDWGAFSVLCVLAALATPHGLSGLISPFSIMTMGTLNQIIEWKPASFATFSVFEGCLLAVLFLCLGRGVRVPWVRLALLLFILHMALQHQRHELVLAAVAPLLLAEPIGRAFGRVLPKSGPMILPAKLMLGGIAAALILARLVLPVTRADGPITPASALAHVPAELRAKPVFNAYNFGGYLIFEGVKPFIDGRADMYGDAFVRRYTQVNNGEQPAVDQALKQYGIAWTITQPKEGIVAALSAKPGWKKIYVDKYAVVMARTDALAASPQPRPKP